MWVVTVHMCGGSTGEAIEQTHDFGFTDQKEAESFESILQQALDPAGSDWWVRCFEVTEIKNLKLPRLTSAQVQALGQPPLAPGQYALDMKAIADQIKEYEQFEVLPPAPKPDEVAAAIASITGGNP